MCERYKVVDCLRTRTLKVKIGMFLVVSCLMSCVFLISFLKTASANTLAGDKVGLYCFEKEKNEYCVGILHAMYYLRYQLSDDCQNHCTPQKTLADVEKCKQVCRKYLEM